MLASLWGEFSPYQSVPQGDPHLSNSIPSGCTLTFAQVLSRHGSRFPARRQSIAYRALTTHIVDLIHQGIVNPTGNAQFLRDYVYNLGSESLVASGVREMRDSGHHFYTRYRSLIDDCGPPPFLRTNSIERVVASAEAFKEGYNSAIMTVDGTHPIEIPDDILTLKALDPVENNTLYWGKCSRFLAHRTDLVPQSVNYKWKFLRPIAMRINSLLQGMHVDEPIAQHLMNLCPFETVAGTADSPFCRLFTSQNWIRYGYDRSLMFWYQFGPGNALGPTQGVGWAQELLARMTGDRTFVNGPNSFNSIDHSLDNGDDTFPLNRKLYADFTHDNIMTTILFALQLYSWSPNLGASLDDTRYTTADGWSPGTTVPFAARAYFEKMRCDGQKDEFVRVIVNDRVVPLKNCGADSDGKCPLPSWINSLNFVTSNGHWDKCDVR